MKISDELREWCDVHCGEECGEYLGVLADRIDNEMVELPKDADGIPICVGDTLHDSMNDEELQVEALRFDGQWEIRTELGYIMPSWFVPVRPDSLERIADDIEAAEDWCDREGEYGTGITSVKESTLREWAERIRKLAAKEGE